MYSLQVFPRLLQARYQCGRNFSSIRGLQAAFRDPSSPFYTPPATKEPTSAPTYLSLDDPAATDPLKEAFQILTPAGFDFASFWEQKITWGDQDPFQHVNTIRMLF